MNVKVSSTEYIIIKKRFKNGDKISDIASDYGVSDQTVRIILRNKCNLKLSQRQGNNCKIQSKDHPRIVRLYQKGTTVARLAMDYNVQSQTIRNILRKNDVYVRVNRGPGRVNSKQRKEIIKMYKKGSSARKIGRLFEISHQQVCNILEQNDVDRRQATNWNKQ